MRLAHLLGSLLLVCLTSPAAALSVVEGADFSDNPAAPSAVGALDLGVNTVSGSINSAALAGDVGDAFSYDVGPSLTVTSVTVSISSFSSNGTPAGTAGDPFAVNIADFPIAADGLSGELLLVPYGNGSFVFELSDANGGGLLDNLSFDYLVTFTAVPEPATGGLLAFALVALGMMRRAQR